MHSGGFSWPASLIQVQLCILAGRNLLITALSKQEKKKKQWKEPSSHAGLSLSFSIAEADSSRPLLWHLPPGPDTAALDPSPAPSPCAGVSKPGQQPRPVHGQGGRKRQQC